MPISPAKNFKTIMAARLLHATAKNSNTAPSRPNDAPGATDYEILLAALGEDIAQLSNISSTEKKAEFKARAIEKYNAHIDATLSAINSSRTAFADEIFARTMVWQLDLEDYSKCLDMAGAMIKYQMPMPNGFNLPCPAWLCKNIAQAAEKTRNTSDDFPLEVLQETENLIAGHDIPDNHLALLHKVLGYKFYNISNILKEGSRPEDLVGETAGELKAAQKTALWHFLAAMELNPNIGVKKEKEKLARALGLL